MAPSIPRRSFLLWLVAVASNTITMKAFGYVLPTFVFSQLANASPAWIASEYNDTNTLLDPEGNKLGAVASESSICSDIGGDILKAGGNAADSMVATVLCVGVIGMYHR